MASLCSLNALEAAPIGDLHVFIIGESAGEALLNSETRQVLSCPVANGC